MRRRLQRLLLIAGLGFLPVVAWAGERKAADIACKPTDRKLIYDCVVTLTGKKSGKPIQGARFRVGADMPSMPGAHNVKPAAAEPMGEAGKYRATLHLDMTGEWALLLDFTKPDRDRVVLIVDVWHPELDDPKRREAVLDRLPHAL